MRLACFAIGLVLAVLANAAPEHDQAFQDPEAAASRRMSHLKREYQKYIHDTIKTRTTSCTSKTISRRREWSSLPIPSRLSYIAAIHCLHANHTHITPLSLIPGVRNRYDDFTGAHLLLTPQVHLSGFFLPFHRYYLYLYETALRTECGYTGDFPYWDWSTSYTDPRKAKIFDGSPWSMGSNGVYVPGRDNVTVLAPGVGERSFPPATGGGCVYAGPFTEDKFKMNLGPVSFQPESEQGPDGGFGYNPRCVKRDLSVAFARDLRPTNVTALIDGCEDLGCFNERLDAERGGVHQSGHFQVGGIELDVFSSPGDPIFWLHHAQVDRLWTIWQSVGDPEGRRNQVWGTQTANNEPPSDNVTLDTPVPFGLLSEPRPIRELVSTIDRPFCYIYD